MMPAAFQKYLPGVAPAGRAWNAPIITALVIARAAHPSISSHAGSRDETIHHAVASKRMPKPHFTPSIQAPALGSSTPEEAPNSNRGTPDPQASANRAEPPSATSPVWEMNNRTPANGAATQRS